MICFHNILKLASCGILLFTYRQISAQALSVASIDDDSPLRVSIRDTWLTEAPALVLKNRPFTRSLPGGSPVQIRIETRGDEFTVILAREWNGRFPGWGPGSWLLTRKITGEYERLRIFLNNDPNTFVQFRPMTTAAAEKTADGKSFMDIVVYEAYVIRGLAVGFSFESLLTMPLNDIFAALGGRFPVQYFDGDPAMYRDTRILLEKVRTAMPGLKFTDDGAIDENGRYVFIRDGSPQGGKGLNCSGFAKWFVDGMLYFYTDRRLPIPPLKRRTVLAGSSLSENYADSRDSWFGLDWTRNLALEAAKVLRPPRENSGVVSIEEIEVRDAFFASVIDRGRGGSSVRSYPGFLLNAGFGVEGLKPLLYALAVNEPGYVYLASVNDERGPEPRLRTHFHVAVLIPYFNEYGVFQTAVFESAEETSLNPFLARHSREMVNLVRIPVEGKFHADE